MGTFKLTSSSSFTCKGASLSDLFETAALASVSLEYDPSTVGFERELNLSARAEDIESLLAAWIDACLRLRIESAFIPGDFIVYEVGEPPGARYGVTLMEAKGAVRGRFEGDWLSPRGRRATAVRPGSVKIIHRRWSKEAVVELETGPQITGGEADGVARID